MASSGKTERLGLNQFAGNDIPKTADYNEDMRRLDEAAAGAAKTIMVTATLTAAGWTGAAAPFTQTINVAGVTAASVNELAPALDSTAAQITALQAANLQDGGQALGKITLKAFGEKPAVNLPIRILIGGDL